MTHKISIGITLIIMAIIFFGQLLSGVSPGIATIVMILFGTKISILLAHKLTGIDPIKGFSD